MPTLSAVWENVVALLDDRISVIPIRDKDENDKLKKSPYSSWKKYQSEIITKEELWFMLEKFNTTAIATVCGKISGNLEVIDVDTKWSVGIDRLLFAEIKQFFPEILDKLRIHKTPSGGYHILYRVTGGIVPPNQKLALRPATEEEISLDNKGKTKCFLETRGEGGYVAAPPSIGYEVVKDNPLPVLEWWERECLINICLSFNQVIKEETVKAPSQDSYYYDENPFESFNKSSTGEQVLTDHGWSYHSQNSRAIYFSRPGSKSKSIHAAFLYDKRLYRFFTTNSEFDVDKSYKPATVLGKLEYGGDMKRLYVSLVGKGYGKIKREVEKTIVKKATLSGSELPANVSVAAKEQYAELLIQQATSCQYGIFWELGERDGWVINRERFLMASEGLGFRLYRRILYKIEGRFLHRKEEKEFFNIMKDYIQDEDGDTHIEILSCFELFLQKSGEFMATRLMDIKDEEVIMDDKDTCYKFYQNGCLTISAEGMSFNDYKGEGLLILNEKIQTRDFKFGDVEGKYLEFLKLACRYEEKKNYLNKIIGYLSHDYKDETTPYIVVLTEECPDPKDGGGSGKNVWCTLFNNTTTVCDTPGSQVKLDEKFLQSWDGQRLMVLSDVNKNFDFGFLKNLSSGAGKLKKLYSDELNIEMKDMPKFVVQTNYGINKIDGGIERRIRQIEFTDFFTKCGGIDIYFDCYFPKGWNEQDWIGYDNLIAVCIKEWIEERKLKYIGLTEGGWLKQFEQTYGANTKMFIETHYERWFELGFINNEDFKKEYEIFCQENMITAQYRLSGVRMNSAIEEWCKDKNWEFDKNKKKRVGGIPENGKGFISLTTPF